MSTLFILANKVQVVAVKKFLAAYKRQWQSVQDTIFLSQRVVSTSRHMTRLIKEYLAEKDGMRKDRLVSQIIQARVA